MTEDGMYECQTPVTESPLRAVVEGTASATGPQFFRALTKHLAAALGVRAVYVGEVARSSRGRVRVLASCPEDPVAMLSEFRLSGSPCAAVLDGAPVHYPSDVSRRFSTDSRLVECRAESYLGLPLIGPDGDVAGILAVIDDKPMPDAADAQLLLSIFAPRAAAEIERMHDEAALREGEARYRSLIEDSFELVAEIDGERYAYVSPAYSRALGYGEEELLGASVFELIHDDDRQAVLAEAQAMMAAKRPGKFIFRLRHKDGSWRWLESIARAFGSNGGGYRGMVFSRDITERREAEEALRASEMRFRTLIESSVDGIHAFDRECRYIVWNPAMERISGVPATQTIGRCAFELFPFLLDTGADECYRKALSGETATVRDRPFAIPETGREGFFDATYSPLRDAQGAVIGGIAVVRDITGRKRSEDRLRLSEERFRTLIEDLGVAIAVMSNDATVRMCNRAALELFGRTREDTLGLNTVDLDVVHEDGSPMPVEDRPVPRAVATKQPVRGVGIGFRRAEGDIIWALCTAEPRLDLNGEVYEVICTFVDIGERVLARAELVESESLLRATLESTTDGLLVTRAGGEILYWNKRLIDLLELPPGLLESGTVRTLAAHLAQGLERPAELRERIESMDPAQPGSLGVMRGKHGRRFDAFVYPLYASNGTRRRVWSVRDVTDREALRESEARLRTIVNHAPVVLLALDLDYRIILLEGRGLDGLAGACDDALGKDLREVAAAYPEALDAAARAMAGEETVVTVCGGGVTYEASFSPLRADDGAITGVIGVAIDVSQRADIEAALRQSEETAKALLDAPTYAAVLVDRDGTILQLNTTARQRLRQYETNRDENAPSSLLGTSIFGVFPPELRDQRRARNEEVFRTGRRARFEDERNGVWTDNTIDPIFDAEGNVVRLAVYSRDITERKQSEEALRTHAREMETLNDYLSATSRELAQSKEELGEKSSQLERMLEAERERSRRDPLTGVLNHGAINRTLDDLVAASAPCAVAMVDVDGMKAANDTFGHQVGDAVLLAVVDAISHDGAIVGRYGGDEFLVALPGADRAQAEDYRRRVRRALEDARVVDPGSGASLPVIASIGLALYPDDAAATAGLIETADELMYAEKKARRAAGGPAMPSSRTVADDRASRTVGELVPLLTSAGDIEDKLRLASQRLSAAGGYDAVHIDVFDDAAAATVAQSAFAQAGDGVLDARRGDQLHARGHPIGELLHRTRRPYIIDAVEEDRRLTETQRSLLASAGIRSAIAVPLIRGGGVIGIMSVGSRQPAAFGARDAQFLMAVATQVTAMVRMTHLVESLGDATRRLGQARDDTVMMLAAAAEAHSQSTPRHPYHVRDLAEALARELGHDAPYAHELGLAAALHDIGDLEVPDALLSTPLRIDRNDAEMASAWETMRRHCLRGRDFLSETNGFELAATVAYYHHEQWDGSGYPEGLAGDAIPEPAAIVTVADAFDAMVSPRPYKPGISVEAAIEEMVSCSGTQFSPRVVDALVRLHARTALPSMLDIPEQSAA